LLSGPDRRFFESTGPETLAALAELTGARIEGSPGDRSIDYAAVLGRAGPGSVSFFADQRLVESARSCKADACFVSERDAVGLPPACVALLTPAPQLAWSITAGQLHRPRRLDPAAPAIHPAAELEEGVAVFPGAVIGEGAQIGRGTSIGPGAVIGPGVAIGRGTEVGARAVVGFALIGDGVRIFAGAVIGEAGFGVTAGPKGLVDIPQLGRVILQDNVSVGANTCIDRGAYEDTVIGENTKIDNLVQIAHNVTIGRNCVLAAHTGLSGSVTIGDGAQLGGRVGLADHVAVGAGARIAASSGVMRDIPAGEVWMGTPARPMRQFFREFAWVTKAASRRSGKGEA
jgi:UDP-3-O-[3-hydroxymyristoyl] glucosamine N-acyltransferase